MTTYPSNCLNGGIFIDVQKYYQYIQNGEIRKILKYQLILQNFPEIIADKDLLYTNKYFISHRWDDENYPDERGWQFDALFQLSSELIHSNKVPACFWYDYCSLPQSPRTSEEDRLYKEGLNSLNILCRTCKIIPLISYTDSDANKSIKNMLRRGWILIELFIAMHYENIHLPLFEKSSDFISYSKRNRINWSDTIPDLIKFLPYYSLDLIRKWLDLNEVKCTIESDLDLISTQLYEHMYKYNGRELWNNFNLFVYDKEIEMSNNEISQYRIDKNGISYLFPEIYFEIQKLGHRYCSIIPRKRPSLNAIDKWTKISKIDFDKFRISLSTKTSILYPGIIFDFIQLNNYYKIKPSVIKINW